MKRLMFRRPAPTPGSNSTFKKTIDLLKKLSEIADNSPIIVNCIDYMIVYISKSSVSQRNQRNNIDSYCKSHLVYVEKTIALTNDVLDLLDTYRAATEPKINPTLLSTIRTQLIAYLNLLVITEYQIVLKRLHFSQRDDLVFQSVTNTDRAIEAFQTTYPTSQAYYESIEKDCGKNVIKFINYLNERLYDCNIVAPVLVFSH